MSVFPESKKRLALEKIMRLRTVKAQRAYSEKLEQWNELKRLKDESQAKIDGFQKDLNRVTEFKETHKHTNSALTLQDAADRRRWLIYDQDLEQYYLGIANDDLQSATTELAALKAIWLQAQNRESNIKDKHLLSIQAESDQAAFLQEIEIEDLQLQSDSLRG